VPEDRTEFRDMTEADLAGGLRLSRASGWNQTLDDWRLLLSLGPDLFRVGVLDGRVVASGGAVVYGDALAWICMILVAPEARGRGLGTRVFEDVLGRTERLRGTGRLNAIGLDATPAGRGLYERHGFVERGDVRRLAAQAAAGLAPSGVTPLDASALDGVLARDRVAFGADRGPLLRALAASAPDLAWASAGGGYCLGRHGDHSDHVGPVVANDPQDALALVRACLSVPRTRPLIVDAVALPSWLDALASLGFREQRPLTRMYRGGQDDPGRPRAVLAIAGPELG
jgi:GNAT superfamily N-acetyltransferase